MAVDVSQSSLTPGLPPFSLARVFLRIMDGVSYPLYHSMNSRIWEQVGNPQANEDWSDPETWAMERLEGEEQKLALRLWRESKGKVNPRHSIWAWRLASNYNLLERGPDNMLHLTPDGKTFLNEPESDLILQIDRQEGMLTILQILSERSPARRAQILPGFTEFCHTYTRYRSETVIKGALYDRLVNLIDRQLVSRSGVMYAITDKGAAYLRKYVGQVPGRAVTSLQTDLQKMARSISHEARESLADYLGKMNPYKFEHLVRLLLEEMGYNNVIVTSPSNDKGVDMVADIELGISSIREVVQVKRHGGSINRVILDQLRGSLHRFKAMRGTVITTGTFSKGAKDAALEPGAAPITLIDGEKLLDLLTQYEIGLSKKAVEFYEFDDSKLQQFEEEEQPEA